jgi:hypothetical protein
MNPYEAPRSNVGSGEVQAPYFKSWALFFLLATIGGGFAGAIAGGLVGAVLGASGVSISLIKVTTSIVGFVVALPISYLSFRWSVARYLVEPLRVNLDVSSPGRQA